MKHNIWKAEIDTKQKNIIADKKLLFHSDLGTAQQGKKEKTIVVSLCLPLS